MNEPIPASSFADTQLNAAGGIDPFLLSILAAAGIAVVLWTWFTLDPGISKRFRLAVVSLRALALVVLLSFLVQPTLQRRILRTLPTRMAVLVDVSGSMTEGGKASRLQNARSLLEEHLKGTEINGQEMAISWYAFADHLQEIDGPKALATTSQASEGTDILGSLRDLEEIHQADPLAAVLLLSDGAHTGELFSQDGEEDGFSTQGPPITTVALTGRRSKADLSIASARTDPFAFTRSETPVEVTVKSVGMETSDVEVTLWHDGAVLQRRPVHLLGGEGKVEFKLSPEVRGRRVLSVSVPIPPEDEIPENNTAHVAFDVVRDKYRVLHLAGHPSWDQRFLRQTLSDWPKVDLVSFYVLRTPYQSSTLGSSGLALIPFPTRDLFEEHLNEFDVIIMQDFDPAAVGVDKYSQQISSFVKDGGGLVVMGGPTAFGSPALVRGPISEVLPVKPLPMGTSAQRLVDAKPFRPRLTENGEHHPIVKLVFGASPGEPVSLPKLDGVARVASPAQGAVTLMEHPHLKADDGQAPLLLAREVEKGRSLALTTDSLWRWRFTAPMTGQLSETYSELWRTVLAWLTREPELSRLRVGVAPATIQQGEAVGIRIEMLDEAYAPVPAAEIDMTLSWMNEQGQATEKRSTVRLDEDGRFYREIEPEGIGPHTVRIATENGLSAADSFLVVDSERERLHMDPAPELLRKLSEATGGTSFTNELDPTEIDVRETPSQETVTREDIPLWDHPLAMLLVFGLLGTEWFIRRRRGLM